MEWQGEAARQVCGNWAPGFAPRRLIRPRPRNRAREHARTEPWPTRAGAPPGRRPRRPGTASAGGTTTAGRREGRTRRVGDGGGNQEEGGGVGAELRVGFGRAASRRERRRRLPIGRRVGFGGSAGEQRLGQCGQGARAPGPSWAYFGLWTPEFRIQNEHCGGEACGSSIIARFRGKQQSSDCDPNP